MVWVVSNVSTQSCVQCQDICSWPTFPMLFRPVVVQLVGEGSHQFFHMNWVVLPYLAQICREEYILNICTGSSVSCGRKLHSPPLAADILGNVPGLWGGMVESRSLPLGNRMGRHCWFQRCVCSREMDFTHTHPSGKYPRSLSALWLGSMQAAQWRDVWNQSVILCNQC